MIQAFDRVAIDYDREFTESLIGRMLRQRVWNYMDRILSGSRKADILELNCGTGEDALFLARRGHRVTATDISEEMLRQASLKVADAGMKDRIDLRKLDIRDVSEVFDNSYFDLVFSDFGGFNCLSSKDLEGLAENLGRRLGPRSRVIAVVMGKMCLWESFYFLFKADLRKVFRRNTSESLRVNVSGHEVETWYYDPAEFASCFSDWFRKVKVIPIGFFLPPSYLEGAMARRPAMLDLLGKLESAVSNATMLSFFSDHYLIDLERR